MDADRFDAASRLFGATGTRRGALTALLAGAFGLASLADPDDAWAASGKCRKPCGACKRCQRGTCVRTADGKRRCKPGRCVSVRNGTRCPGGTCLGGRCAPFPTPPPCRSLRQSCDNDCCGGLVCDRNGCEPGNVCLVPIGKRCQGDECNCSNLRQNCSSVTDTCRACVFPGETCQVADDCCICSNDCDCGTSAGDQENVCCFTEGSINCLRTSECCAGLVCVIDEEGFGECVPAPR
jgi:hypothetical protein